MNQLHPGARWIFRINAYSRFGGLFFIFIYFIIISSMNRNLLTTIFGNSILITFFSVLLFVIIFVLIVGEIYARMAYNRYLYDITHDGVKIEHGIIWKKYTSVPYERVQNVDIRRGILARIIGFSTLDIETAGSSGMMYYRRRRHYMSEGHIPAVGIDEAEELREFVLGKISKRGRSQGL